MWNSMGYEYFVVVVSEAAIVVVIVFGNLEDSINAGAKAQRRGKSIFMDDLFCGFCDLALLRLILSAQLRNLDYWSEPLQPPK